MSIEDNQGRYVSKCACVAVLLDIPEAESCHRHANEHARSNLCISAPCDAHQQATAARTDPRRLPYHLHPAQWLQILSASGTSLLALAISSVLALNAGEEENVSVLPVLPWLGASVGVVLAAVGSLLADAYLMSFALWVTIPAVVLWISVIVIAGLAALAKGSIDATT